LLAHRSHRHRRDHGKHAFQDALAYSGASAFLSCLRRRQLHLPPALLVDVLQGDGEFHPTILESTDTVSFVAVTPLPKVPRSLSVKT
jgi:hypothetical protein